MAECLHLSGVGQIRKLEHLSKLVHFVDRSISCGEEAEILEPLRLQGCFRMQWAEESWRPRAEQYARLRCLADWSHAKQVTGWQLPNLIFPSLRIDTITHPSSLVHSIEKWTSKPF